MDFTDKVGLVAGGGSGSVSHQCAVRRAGRGRPGGGHQRGPPRRPQPRRSSERAVGPRPPGCDVTRWEDVQATVERARRTFGRLDVLVNCAGILRGHLIEETAEVEWRQVLDINLTGAFLQTKAVMTAMREQGQGGAIVLIASAWLSAPGRGSPLYGASKAGILQLTQMAAVEGAPHKIRANCVVPGVVDSPMTRDPIQGDVEAQLAGWAKACRWVVPASPRTWPRPCCFSHRTMRRSSPAWRCR